MVNLSSKQTRFHFVQKAYLKNFSREGREGEVYVLNKDTLVSNIQGVNRIAIEEDFYYESMEILFNKEFETNTPKIFNKIITNSIDSLNTTDREVLAKFVNYHILRTKNVRKQIEAEIKLSGKKYVEEETKKLHDSTIRVFSDDYKQLMKLQLVPRAKGEKSAKLVTSDVPVVIYNYRTPNDPKSYSCYFNGSIIILPIDPNKAIMYINDNKTIKKKDLEKILRLNYFQSVMSNKFIYSSTNDFKLIKSYIKKEKLQPWTLDDRKDAITKFYNSFPIRLELGRDLWQEWGNRTYFSIMEEMSKHCNDILDKIPKREPYTCVRCGKTSNICIQKSQPEKPDRCIECGEPIIE